MPAVVSATVASILASLEVVDKERRRRAQYADLQWAVVAVKEFQQRRFTRMYADLLASARYGAVARFFLDELYGPTDFTRRDAQFARVVPALVRLFPDEVVQAVARLADLHAMSEVLDSAMGAALHAPPLDARRYVSLWQSTGRPADRQAQIDLTLEVAARLDLFTRKPLLRHGLRLMRAPARAAGMAELQHFLETGFDTFRALNGAQEFISMVRTREEALASNLFAADFGATPLTEATVVNAGQEPRLFDGEEAVS